MLKFASWFRRARVRRPDAPPVRLGFERLEDRIVPSLVSDNYAALLTRLQQPTSWADVTATPVGGPITVGGNLTAPLQGDFNGDGVTDLAMFRTDVGAWVIGISVRDRFIWQVWATNWSAGNVWTAFRVADFNGDGLADIAALHVTGEWWVARSTGAGFAVSRWSNDWSAGNTYRTIQVGDFNGDGKTDIAALDTAGFWWLARSNVTSFTTVIPTGRWSGGTAWAGLFVGDFDGDGKDDVAALHVSGEWWVAQGTTTGFITTRWMPVWVAGVTSWKTVLAGDFDGDGKTDLAGFTAPGRWFLARSTGSTFTTVAWAQSWTDASTWQSFQAADFDHDGRAEILALHSTGTWWMLSGTATTFRSALWSGAVFPPGSYGLYGTGDFNGDGNADVLLMDAAGRLYAGLGTGPIGVFGAPPASQYFVAPWDVEDVRAAPAHFAEVFGRYQKRLKLFLGGPFAGLDDNGLALVFATVLAEQFASYRGVNDPEGTFPAPPTWTLPDLSAAPKLVCDEYCALVTQLFRAYHPDDPADPISIRFLGWDKGLMGNHAQLLVTGVGVPLLLDATSGYVAAVDLATLGAGTPVAAARIRAPSIRVEAAGTTEATLAFFRNAVYTSISTGLYPQSVTLFNRDMDDYLRSLGWA